MTDLKTVYQADTKDLAEHNLLKLDEKWGEKYPMVIKSWQQNWDLLSTYFK
jgi:transposase-like protein